MQKHPGLADFTTDTRALGLSVFALVVGALGAVVAYALVCRGGDVRERGRRAR